MIDLASIPWADLAPFILIGFFAQLVDSALGMAFGVISNSLLLLLGLPPMAASAATHTVEGLASGTSGAAHALQRNVDWPLFARLVLPGIVGGLIGVWVLTFVHTDIARPVVLVYLAAIGAYLIWRAPRRPQAYRRMRLVGPLGFIGGFLDASGGGWGPIVTGNLLAQGMTPRMAVGTVNAAEFFVTVTVLSAFIGTLGLSSFTQAASGLLIGGIAAAPAGAWLTKRISPKLLMQLVGIVLIGISLWGFISLMFDPVPVFQRF
ncbi:MAG: sulfite exporter TauE/SafE family protein [Sphingomonas sp.]|nr:sulfite exporter TauE/SafE family protein [Sphingomonas sp.]MDX3885396.1 sulfite exporter TauE/SafE family protein [Sphingomonas sp.]